MAVMNETQSKTTLDTMTFPLHGARLIEASAGTGKTFTIAGLYLRLLLGHGENGSAHQKPLTVDQILVVTFTEAATAELRDRIRARIHDARIAFSRGHSSDPVIAPLLTAIQDHRQASEILLQAERQMDEAAVYTIHGFCQRMLTQNAFESGSRFNNEFVTDESHLKAQIVADYWRKNFYPLPINLVDEVRKIWTSPNKLLKGISRYLTGSPLKLSVAAMQGDLSQLHTQNIEKIDELKQQWRDSQADIEKIIAGSDVNKRSYTKKSLPTWIETVSQWAAAETRSYEVSDKLEKFAQSVLNEKTPKGTPPSHPLFIAIDDFLANQPSLKAPLLAHAIESCRSMLASAKQQKQWLSFDDLLTNLSAAIDTDEQQLLTERIRTLYPVAMIDEFQDTDPLQYSIFSRIYLDNPECGLFMIGDPKQAIYGFRGADIFTYIKARNQVSSHFSLDTNWRSSADMVQAVNQIFETPTSAFIYDEDIPFTPVNSSPNADLRQWTLAGQKQPALSYWLQESDDNKPVNKGSYFDAMTQVTADKIQQILTLSQQGEATLGSGDKQSPIQAGDIAVLVRTGAEGRKIKDALAKQGIASVYLSNRDSVFSSNMAKDLQRLLQAVLTPDNDRALRASLASELFALDASALDKLNNDENAWEAALAEFKEYRKLWSQRGVLPMIRSVMAKRHIAERLLEEESGERNLTDLMHIGELLQQASNDLESDHGLLRWLSQAIDDAEKGLGGSDDQIQRLESERNLVQIVTIHKSKGLEYDLVFLPFVMAYREATEAKYYDSQMDQTILDLNNDKASLELADKERLAEDLRLIYVALTRAVYGCFIGAAPIKKGKSSKEPTGVHLSAMGYLLQNGEELGIAGLESAINQQTQNLSCVVNATLPDEHDRAFVALTGEAETLQARVLQTPIDRDWRMTSYSGIVRQGTQAHSDALSDLVRLDIDSSGDSDDNETLEPERSIFTFPRGARPGTFLHSLFEEIEFTMPASSEENTQVIARLMESEQIEEAWLPILQQLVDTVLSTPLDGKKLRLNQKNSAQRLVEMEFLLPIKVLAAPALNRVIQRHDPLSSRAGDLGFYTVKGMIKGFIDLVFEHQGKYYVLDWKSNHLGDEVNFYHGEALKSAMVDHRYDLQYQIYALALHRFLRSRVANYDYDTHFGGVYYLFLRGMDGESDHGIFNAKPSREFLDEMDHLIDGKAIEQRSNNAGQMELL